MEVRELRSKRSHLILAVFSLITSIYQKLLTSEEAMRIINSANSLLSLSLQICQICNQLKPNRLCLSSKRIQGMWILGFCKRTVSLKYNRLLYKKDLIAIKINNQTSIKYTITLWISSRKAG